jgi:hypothetical protein
MEGCFVEDLRTLLPMNSWLAQGVYQKQHVSVRESWELIGLF